MTIGPDWVVLDSVDSTQKEAVRLLDAGKHPDVVFAKDQTQGAGRFDRRWHSDPGESLTVSFLFYGQDLHPKPWLIGMSVAVAAANALDCRLRWPNDLVMGSRKLGGVLSQLHIGVYVVGLGVNLNQSSFPMELRQTATSQLLESGVRSEPLCVARAVIEELSHFPVPDEWSELKARWSLRDTTPGKLYSHADGRQVLATGIGSMGELVGICGSEETRVFAAEALFGTA